MLVEFLHDFFNLILGLFLLRMMQLHLERRDSPAAKAIAFIH